MIHRDRPQRASANKPALRASTSSTADFARRGDCCPVPGVAQAESVHFVQLLSTWLHAAKLKQRTPAAASAAASTALRSPALQTAAATGAETAAAPMEWTQSTHKPHTATATGPRQGSRMQVQQQGSSSMPASAAAAAAAGRPAATFLAPSAGGSGAWATSSRGQTEQHPHQDQQVPHQQQQQQQSTAFQIQPADDDFAAPQGRQEQLAADAATADAVPPHAAGAACVSPAGQHDTLQQQQLNMHADYVDDSSSRSVHHEHSRQASQQQQRRQESPHYSSYTHTEQYEVWSASSSSSGSIISGSSSSSSALLAAAAAAVLELECNHHLGAAGTSAAAAAATMRWPDSMQQQQYQQQQLQYRSVGPAAGASAVAGFGTRDDASGWSIHDQQWMDLAERYTAAVQTYSFDPCSPRQHSSSSVHDRLSSAVVPHLAAETLSTGAAASPAWLHAAAAADSAASVQAYDSPRPHPTSSSQQYVPSRASTEWEPLLAELLGVPPSDVLLQEHEGEQQRQHGGQQQRLIHLLKGLDLSPGRPEITGTTAGPAAPQSTADPWSPSSLAAHTYAAAVAAPAATPATYAAADVVTPAVRTPAKGASEQHNEQPTPARGLPFSPRPQHWCSPGSTPPVLLPPPPASPPVLPPHADAAASAAEPPAAAAAAVAAPGGAFTPANTPARMPGSIPENMPAEAVAAFAAAPAVVAAPSAGMSPQQQQQQRSTQGHHYRNHQPQQQEWLHSERSSLSSNVSTASSLYTLSKWDRSFLPGCRLAAWPTTAAAAAGGGGGAARGCAWRHASRHKSSSSSSSQQPLPSASAAAVRQQEQQRQQQQGWQLGCSSAGLDWQLQVLAAAGGSIDALAADLAGGTLSELFWDQAGAGEGTTGDTGAAAAVSAAAGVFKADAESAPSEASSGRASLTFTDCCWPDKLSRSRYPSKRRQQHLSALQPAVHAAAQPAEAGSTVSVAGSTASGWVSGLLWPVPEDAEVLTSPAHTQQQQLAAVTPAAAAAAAVAAAAAAARDEAAAAAGRQGDVVGLLLRSVVAQQPPSPGRPSSSSSTNYEGCGQHQQQRARLHGSFSGIDVSRASSGPVSVAADGAAATAPGVDSMLSLLATTPPTSPSWQQQPDTMPFPAPQRQLQQQQVTEHVAAAAGAAAVGDDGRSDIPAGQGRLDQQRQRQQQLRKASQARLSGTASDQQLMRQQQQQQQQPGLLLEAVPAGTLPSGAAGSAAAFTAAVEPASAPHAAATAAMPASVLDAVALAGTLPSLCGLLPISGMSGACSCCGRQCHADSALLLPGSSTADGGQSLPAGNAAAAASDAASEAESPSWQQQGAAHVSGTAATPASASSAGWQPSREVGEEWASAIVNAALTPAAAVTAVERQSFGSVASTFDRTAAALVTYHGQHDRPAAGMENCAAADTVGSIHTAADGGGEVVQVTHNPLFEPVECLGRSHTTHSATATGPQPAGASAASPAAAGVEMVPSSPGIYAAAAAAAAVAAAAAALGGMGWDWDDCMDVNAAEQQQQQQQQSETGEQHLSWQELQLQDEQQQQQQQQQRVMQAEDQQQQQHQQLHEQCAAGQQQSRPMAAVLLHASRLLEALMADLQQLQHMQLAHQDTAPAPEQQLPARNSFSTQQGGGSTAAASSALQREVLGWLLADVSALHQLLLTSESLEAAALEQLQGLLANETFQQLVGQVQALAAAAQQRQRQQFDKQQECVAATALGGHSGQQLPAAGESNAAAPRDSAAAAAPPPTAALAPLPRVAVRSVQDAASQPASLAAAAAAAFPTATAGYMGEHGVFTSGDNVLLGSPSFSSRTISSSRRLFVPSGSSAATAGGAAGVAATTPSALSARYPRLRAAEVTTPAVAISAAAPAAEEVPTPVVTAVAAAAPAADGTAEGTQLPPGMSAASLHAAPEQHAAAVAEYRVSGGVAAHTAAAPATAGAAVNAVSVTAGAAPSGGALLCNSCLRASLELAGSLLPSTPAAAAAAAAAAGATAALPVLSEPFSEVFGQPHTGCGEQQLFQPVLQPPQQSMLLPSSPSTRTSAGRYSSNSPTPLQRLQAQPVQSPATITSTTTFSSTPTSSPMLPIVPHGYPGVPMSPVSSPAAGVGSPGAAGRLAAAAGTEEATAIQASLAGAVAAAATARKALQLSQEPAGTFSHTQGMGTLHQGVQRQLELRQQLQQQQQQQSQAPVGAVPMAVAGTGMAGLGLEGLLQPHNGGGVGSSVEGPSPSGTSAALALAAAGTAGAGMMAGTSSSQPGVVGAAAVPTTDAMRDVSAAGYFDQFERGAAGAADTEHTKGSSSDDFFRTSSGSSPDGQAEPDSMFPDMMDGSGSLEPLIPRPDSASPDSLAALSPMPDSPPTARHSPSPDSLSPIRPDTSLEGLSLGDLRELLGRVAKASLHRLQKQQQQRQQQQALTQLGSEPHQQPQQQTQQQPQQQLLPRGVSVGCTSVTASSISFRHIAATPPAAHAAHQPAVAAATAAAAWAPPAMSEGLLHQQPQEGTYIAHQQQELDIIDDAGTPRPRSRLQQQPVPGHNSFGLPHPPLQHLHQQQALERLHAPGSAAAGSPTAQAAAGSAYLPAALPLAGAPAGAEREMSQPVSGFGSRQQQAAAASPSSPTAMAGSPAGSNASLLHLLQLLAADGPDNVLESLSLGQLAAVLRAARSSSLQRSQSVPEELVNQARQQQQQYGQEEAAEVQMQEARPASRTLGADGLAGEVGRRSTAPVAGDGVQ